MGFVASGQSSNKNNRRLQKTTNKYFRRKINPITKEEISEEYLDEELRDRIEKRRIKDFQERIKNNERIEIVGKTIRILYIVILVMIILLLL